MSSLVHAALTIRKTARASFGFVAASAFAVLVLLGVFLVDPESLGVEHGAVGLAWLAIFGVRAAKLQRHGMFLGRVIEQMRFLRGRLRAGLRGKAADLDAAIESYNASVIDAVRDAARLLLAAERPMIWAGQGVLYGEATAAMVSSVGGSMPGAPIGGGHVRAAGL